MMLESIFTNVNCYELLNVQHIMVNISNIFKYVPQNSTSTA